MPNGDHVIGANDVVSVRLGWKAWSAIAGLALTAPAGALKIFGPAFLAAAKEQAEEIVEERIDEYDAFHTIIPHNGAATQTDLKHVVEGMGSLATSAAVQRVQDSVDRVQLDVGSIHEDIEAVERDVKELDRKVNRGGG